MNKFTIFITLTGYQIVWLACVFGEIKFNTPSLGIYVGITFLIIYFYFNKNKVNFIRTSLLISIPGYIFDTLIVFLNVYEFKTTFLLGTLPIWMIVLWLSFSTLFDKIFIIFSKYKLLGIILSGSLAPLTYYVGEPIGIIKIHNVFLFFLIMVIFWVLLMICYQNIILKKIQF